VQAPRRRPHGPAHAHARGGSFPTTHVHAHVEGRIPPLFHLGKYVCEECSRTFDTISGLGSHRSRCDGGVWRCEWCNADYASSSGKVSLLVITPYTSSWQGAVAY